MSSSTPSLPRSAPTSFESKDALRHRMLAARANFSAPEVSARNLMQQAQFLMGRWENPIVGAYWPMRGEIDPLMLLAACAQRGWVTALPVVIGPAEPLAFRQWRPALGDYPPDPLCDGPFKTRHPLEAASGVVPTVLFIPLVAFDRRGYRLGYGGGFYDRTLEGLRHSHEVTAIGVAHASQEVEKIPCEDHDQRLDWVVTDRAVFGPFKK